MSDVGRLVWMRVGPFDAVQFADSVRTKFSDPLLHAVSLVFSRAKRALHQDVRSLAEHLDGFRQFSECNDAMPFRSTLPFVVLVSPRFLRRHGKGDDGSAIGGVTQFRVLSCKSDDRQLIQIHCVLLLVCSPKCLGAPKRRTHPLPEDEVLCWGTVDGRCSQ